MAKLKYDNLAQLVVERREILGLSTTGLAKKCNLTIDEISSIESGVEVFLSSTVRQKLAKGLKLELADIKVYEKGDNTSFVSKSAMLEIKEAILISNAKEELFCPVCNSKLIIRIAKMYDLEDNLILEPKARCSKCPFQLQSGI